MKNLPTRFRDLPTFCFSNTASKMMYRIRAFFGILQIASILVAVTLMPANASAMVSCSVEQAVQVSSNERHHHETDIPAADIDHGADHCASHICVVGDFVGAESCTKQSANVSLRSWDIASLVRSAIPEGLRRPPRA